MHNAIQSFSSNDNVNLYRIALLIIIFSSLTTATVGVIANKPIFEIPLFIGSLIFFLNTIMASLLYYYSIKHKNYTSILFGVSMLLTGIATFITGINGKGGIFIIIVSLIFFLICFKSVNKSEYVL